MKNNSDLDGKTSFARARPARALRNINITDRVFGRGHHLCRANRIGRPMCECAVLVPLRRVKISCDVLVFSSPTKLFSLPMIVARAPPIAVAATAVAAAAAVPAPTLASNTFVVIAATRQDERCVVVAVPAEGARSAVSDQGSRCS